MSGLQRLKGSQRVRQRVNVMFGSSDVNGVFQSIFELGSNVLDRFKKGYGDTLKITKHKDLSYTIEDFADGLPMDWSEKEKGYNWDLALKVLYAGDNYTDNKMSVIGNHGLGLTATQYSSEFMTVTSYRDGKKYIVKCKKGRPIDKDTGEYICEDDDYLFAKEQGERVLKIEDSETNRTGTVIHYKSDTEVFTDINVPMEWIVDKFKKQAFVNKGIKIEIIDETNDKEYIMQYDDGIKDYIKELSDGDNLIDIIEFEAKGKGRDREDKDEYEAMYELVFTFNNAKRDLKCFHNSSELSQGGVTLEAIQNAFTHAIHNYIDKNNMYNKGEKKIKFTDIEESFICIISSASTFTSYSNQTKLSIDNKFIKEFVTDTLKQKLEIYFTENKLEATKICQQVLANSRARNKAEKTRLDIKKKLQSNINSIENKINGFYNAKSKDKSQTILTICEGKSALSAMLSGRQDIHAIFPIRGKILNCLKAPLDKALSNEVVTNLIKVLGCGVEVGKDKRNFNIDNLNFSKIMIYTDGDVDGIGSILPLLLTVFWKLTPTLVKEGRIYICETPRYEIAVGDEHCYAIDDMELEQLQENLKGKKYTTHYVKGLAELSSEAMAMCLSPGYKNVTQITLDNIEDSINTLELFMGSDITPRREVILKSFEQIS